MNKTTPLHILEKTNIVLIILIFSIGATILTLYLSNKKLEELANIEIMTNSTLNEWKEVENFTRELLTAQFIDETRNRWLKAINKFDINYLSFIDSSQIKELAATDYEIEQHVRALTPLWKQTKSRFNETDSNLKNYIIETEGSPLSGNMLVNMGRQMERREYTANHKLLISDLSALISISTNIFIKALADLDTLVKVSIKKQTSSLKIYSYILSFLFLSAAGLFIGYHTKRLSLSRDLSRQHAEELRLSEEQHRSILQTAMDGFWLVDMRGNLLKVNESYCHMSGYSEQELLTMTVPDLEAVESEADTAEHIKKVIAQGSDRFESRHLRKDGSIFDVEISVQLQRLEEVRMVVFLRDITERKHVEKELKERHGLLIGVMEGTTDAVFVKDIESRYIIVNEATVKAMGKSVNEIIGKNDIEIFSLEAGRQLMETDNKIMSEGKTQTVEEYTITGNVRRLWQTTKGVYRDAEGTVAGIFGIARDMTERRQLEEERQKSHKLESIGILAGGIAHDFNNMLAAIRNNVYLSMIHMDRKDKSYENLESAEKIIARATNLTQQLLTFSRGGAPIKKTSSIIELINESTEFVLKGSNVKCEYNKADNLWLAEVDEGQMSQVIHNLILNAAQSMPKGGAIKISTENSELGSDTDLPIQEGRYVKIVIQDQGIGISEENLKSLFDPYFTTKEMGRGLGLSVVYSIIKNHVGHISVESEIGTGTTFTIYLPASDKQIEEKETLEDTFADGEGKILLMDDEEIIRDSLGQLLTHKGYKVVLAKDGNEAIEFYKEAMKASKPFDAVILDLTIRGGMGGKEAMKKLREIDPDVKAIVASGYSNDPVLANFKKYGFVGIFAKHDKTEELGKTLHQVINGYK